MIYFGQEVHIRASYLHSALTKYSDVMPCHRSLKNSWPKSNEPMLHHYAIDVAKQETKKNI